MYLNSDAMNSRAFVLSSFPIAWLARIVVPVVSAKMAEIVVHIGAVAFPTALM